MRNADPMPKIHPEARYWPVPVALLVAALSGWAAVQFGGRLAVVPLGLVVIALFGFLLMWALRFSRLRDAKRRIAVMLVLVGFLLPVALFRVRAFTGRMIPILSFRFVDRMLAFDMENPGAVVVLKPSPHDVTEAFGPGRRPSYPAMNLARSWDTKPKELWRKELGEGFSSFVVVGDYAFTQSQLGLDEAVICLRWATGETAWVHKDPVSFKSSVGGNGPRATPTFADGKLFTVGATGLVNCLDATNGEVVWSLDLVADLRGRAPQWGYANSPLVADGRVYVAPGGADGWSAVALDADTGEVVWHAGDEAAGYTSPMLATLAGERTILLATDRRITAYRVADGEVLWQAKIGRGQSCSQPLVLGDDLVVYSKEYGTGSKAWRLTKGEDGTLKGETVWKSRRVMKTKFSQSIVFEGHVYGISAGAALECMDPMTGKKLWSERGGFGHGQTIRTGAFLLVVSERGELILLEANPERYVELARMPLFDGQRTWNPPTLVGRTLLTRNDVEAVALELPLAGE